MLSFEQAQQIAEQEIQNMRYKERDDDYLVISETMEISNAWIFLYTSKMHLETNNILYALGGNAPLFVSKTDGEISQFSTGYSIEGMIEQYEEKKSTWKLKLTDCTFSDVRKMYSLKVILGITQAKLKELKEARSCIIDKGSKRRIDILAQLLRDKGIDTITALD